MMSLKDPLIHRLDTKHGDIIHDIQFDYYSKRLATCSSDRNINIFELDGPDQHKLIQTLKGHEGPVWKVAWAPGKWNSILASCSYDGKVYLWKDQGGGKYVIIKEHAVHQGSVNDLSWADDEMGLFLACGSSDGKISILRMENDEWKADLFNAHSIGCNSVAWCPLDECEDDEISINSLVLASGGCDNAIRSWKFKDGEWKEEGEPLLGHSDWIRDISWAPCYGTELKRLASCSQDKNVYLWTLDSRTLRLQFKYSLNEGFPEIVWRVNWSPTGILLAVAYGDNHVSLWKETREGEWINIDCLE
jgi:protein transport protein SEC13